MVVVATDPVSPAADDRLPAWLSNPSAPVAPLGSSRGRVELAFAVVIVSTAEEEKLPRRPALAGTLRFRKSMHNLPLAEAPAGREET